MGFDRRTVTFPVVAAAATTTTATLNTRSTYIRPLSFQMVTAVGTEATIALEMIDADSRRFYSEASADYSGTTLYRQLASDDQVSGGAALTVFPYTSVGVAVEAEQLSPMPVVKSPITLNITSATAADAYVLTMDYEYGCFNAVTFTTDAAVAGVITKTVSLDAKYAQILGFRAISSSDDALTIQLSDADSKIVYLDAADKAYASAGAGLDKVIILDPTATNLTKTVPINSIGEAAGAGIGRVEPPLVRSPITITLANAGTSTLATTIYYKTG